MIKDSTELNSAHKAFTPTVVRSTLPLARFHQRIDEKAQDRSAPPIVIVALGDSVTHGLAGVDEFLHEETYHHQLKRLLQNRYPLSIFNVINEGVDGQSAVDGITRFERSVAAYQPDLLLIAFSLNDAAGLGIAGLDMYASHIETLLRRTRKETSADVILLTPNMMLTRENDSIPDCYRFLTQRFLRLQLDGVLAVFAQRLGEIGRRQGVPVADIYAAWQRLSERGDDVMDLLANGLNHPNRRGHALAAETIMQVIESSNISERIESI